MSLSLLKQKDRKSGEAVKFHGDYVLKSYEIDLLGELEKAEKIHQLSDGESLIVPAPLGWDSEAGWIKYEFISQTTSIRDHYLKFMKAAYDDETGIEIFYNAGKALGMIHDKLRLSKFELWEPSTLFVKSMNEFGDNCLDRILGSKVVAVHGDFSFGNIHVKARSNGVVVFDPSSNGFVTQSSNLVGPYYLDIGNFICNINGLVPLHTYFGLKWRKIGSIKRAFISGYQESSGNFVEIELLDKVVYATARSYFGYTYNNSFLQYLAINMLFNSFKGNKLSFE